MPNQFYESATIVLLGTRLGVTASPLVRLLLGSSPRGRFYGSAWSRPTIRLSTLLVGVIVVCADTQLGMTNDNKDWHIEVEYSSQAVKHINRLSPLPLFCCVCGDLVHMTSRIYARSPEQVVDCDAVQDAQNMDFKRVWSGLHKDIALVCVCGNHDVGNTPTAASIERFRGAFGDDYLAFWVRALRLTCAALNFISHTR